MGKNNKDDDLWADLLDEDPGILSRLFLNRKLWSFIVLVIAGFSFGYVIWAGVYGGNNVVEEIPYFEASKTPYKNKVTNIVPQQENTVFDVISLDKEIESVEVLVVEKEEKIDRESLFAGFKTDISPNNSTNIVTKKDKVVEQIKIISMENDMVKVSDLIIEPKQNVKLRLPEKRIVVLKSSKVKTAKATVKNINKKWLVQLASVQSRSVAVKEWSRLSKIYKLASYNLRLNIQEAKIKNRGVFYRIRGGEVSKIEAKDICRMIKSKYAGACIAVKN